MHQISFDPLKYSDMHSGISEIDAKKLALKERNQTLREIKKRDPMAYGWALPNQLRKYAGLGQLDGRSRTVYYISTSNPGGLTNA